MDAIPKLDLLVEATSEGRSLVQRSLEEVEGELEQRRRELESIPMDLDLERECCKDKRRSLEEERKKLRVRQDDGMFVLKPLQPLDLQRGMKSLQRVVPMMYRCLRAFLVPLLEFLMI